MLIIGQGALGRPDGGAVLAAARAVALSCTMISPDWCGFNVLHTAAARVAGLDLGFVPKAGGRDVAGILAGAVSGAIKVVYLLAADEFDTTALGKAFVIYQGSHGDAGAHRADVVLPGAAYTEKNATWVNTEGRVQFGHRAVPPPGEAREDWSIIRALSDVLRHPLPYDTIQELRARMAKAAPHFANLDRIESSPFGAFGRAGPLDAAPFQSLVRDFYLTNPIARSSGTMAQCAKLARRAFKSTGTDG